MSLPLTTDEGVVYVTTSGTPVYWNAGLGYDIAGALCITTTVSASDTYIGGKRRDAVGRLVVADASIGGTPFNFNAGWPSDKNTGATIRQINQTPTATDPRVAGIAIGPRGGVYMTTDPIPNPGVFSPADLFANGEIGFWYDPSDFSTMFQDNLGTIPVTAVGQPVGRILDKSGNLNHAIQATSTARPTLRQDSANAYYLDFDGVDDYISTAAFNMGASGKVTMFAGTANAKTTGSGTLCEFSPNYMNNGGSFAMLTPSLATSHISFGSRGSLGAGEKETQQPPAGGLEKRVITAAQTFATDGDYGCDYIRFNQIPLGNLIGAGNSNVGAGPLGTFKMNIGAREGGTTNRLQGRIYSLICASNMYAEATLVSCEEWIDAKLNPGGAVWSPALLFASGEQGAWYDPSDLTTMFKDRAGITPVTADGQTVGLILDKSKGLALGSELVTNGDFSNGSTGWTLGTGWSISNGKATADTTLGDISQTINQSYSGAVGITYLVTATVTMLATPDPMASVGINIGGSGEDLFCLTSTNLQSGNTYQIARKARLTSASSFVLRVGSGDGLNYPLNYTVDNISVKKIAGNHATAPSDAGRPLKTSTSAADWINYDAVDDVLNTTFASSLGTDCTVARANVGAGPTILTAQTIGTSYADSTDHAGLIIVNRALTGPETTNLTAWLTAKGATA